MDTDWIRPGVRATLIWVDGDREFPSGRRCYEVAGPALEERPPSPFFVVAPLAQSEFAGRLYRGQVTLDNLRRFLGECRIVRGGLSEGCDVLVAAEEAPLLPLLDEWAGDEGGALVPYRDEIEAFLSDDHALHVTANAHLAAQRFPEHFGSTWVCEACGEPEDAANFLWTVHRGSTIQVRLAIENVGGAWTCWLHPFQIVKAEASMPASTP